MDIADAAAVWIDRYRRAWESNDPGDIRVLFTEDGTYATEPWAEPWRGRDAIVDQWLERQDDPGATTFRWHPIVTSGDIAVIEGTTEYANGPTYSNLWVIRMAPDGRARSFTEWWMDHARSS